MIFLGFSGLASLLASVQFPSGDTDIFVNPQISEARYVISKHTNEARNQLRTAENEQTLKRNANKKKRQHNDKN